MAESVLQNEADSVTTNKFDSKIEASCAKIYFQFYSQLWLQQTMLQDFLRTGTYFYAITRNRADFVGKVVVDVGAGSGILSLFAAEAGAKHVYAVEASEMAEYARKLIAGNPSLSDRITVVKGKVEEVELPEKADILISETMGNLLVNERMLESYVIARDRFLVPYGKMFPGVGRIHMAPFCDEDLFLEISNKAHFWQSTNFFGVDLTALYESASQGSFSQPVVDSFDPKHLVAPAICHVLDLTSIKEEQLYEIDIPLKFTAEVDTKVHGLACWFDVMFKGSSLSVILTTAPGYSTTHWQQLRCVLAQDMYVMAGQEITGHLHMVARNNQSYILYLELSGWLLFLHCCTGMLYMLELPVFDVLYSPVAEMYGAGAEGTRQISSGKIELKESYYRMSQPCLRQQLIEVMNQLIINLSC